ncbi:unnamed protein product [Lota lota]
MMDVALGRGGKLGLLLQRTVAADWLLQPPDRGPASFPHAYSYGRYQLISFTFGSSFPQEDGVLWVAIRQPSEQPGGAGPLLRPCTQVRLLQSPGDQAEDFLTIVPPFDLEPSCGPVTNKAEDHHAGPHITGPQKT